MNLAPAPLGIILLSCALATGCATTPPADANRVQATSVEQISKQWKQGNDLVAQGEDTRRQAQAKIDAANLELKEGDSMIVRGRTLMTESEQAFRDSSRKVGQTQDATSKK